MQQPDSRSALPFLEAALLWSMRAWVLGRKKNLDFSVHTHRLFTRFGAPEAADHLDRFMIALSRQAARQIDVDCVCRVDVTADEALLLDALALSQAGYGDDQRALIEQFTGTGAALLACREAAALVRSLNAQGNFLDRGKQAISRHAFNHLASLRNLDGFSRQLN